MRFFRVLLLVVGTFSVVACQNENKPTDEEVQMALPHGEPVKTNELSDSDLKKIANSKGKTVEAVTFAELEELLENTEDMLLVCNFWATWCKPCIEEMPYFDKLEDEFEGKNVKVLFVSLDNPKARETQVTTFVRKKQVRSETVLLDEKVLTQDEWIQKLMPSWEGDIPATIFVKTSNDIREFYAGSFEDYNQLKAQIIPYL
jgi:thiol-disulfide isomerase/thioredoxin